ncbi:MAG: TetR/AcrR family transcriptional regulator [Erysipelotrichaceae bacterium]|nr:TetR/AcrR family transcriptional regulator [Erysipelotrichaceae bacterium]MDD3924509.1 TetR/AcrR family transcriptional regulator [Erysipelotrichaceae bacterium]MDD4642709.1 TetR/AcrR family transcriptional regulator [Erysipelotrichaceae bacterium]
MAQTLKDEVRKRIEQAAIGQLVQNGMHKTNMRDIAKNAGITPGNLYRYFPSKDQLIISITKPIIDGINIIVQKETGIDIDLSQKQRILPKTPMGMNKLTYMELILVEKLRNALIEIGELSVAYPLQMMILLDDSIVSKHLYQWGISIIQKAYDDLFETINIESDQINIMINVVTMSFCEGVVELLKALLNDKDLNSYISMLDSYLFIQKAGIGELLKHELIHGNIKEKD